MAVCRTPLHKALFLGRLVAAGILLEGGAQLNIQDHQVRFLITQGGPFMWYSVDHLLPAKTQPTASPVAGAPFTKFQGG